MRILKLLAVGVIAIGAAAAMRVLVWTPCECNRLTRHFNEQTVAVQVNPATTYELARRNVEQLRRLEKRCPLELEIPMLLAQNHLALGHYGDAISAYQRALKLGRRPEIYQFLGQAQATAGRREEAMLNLLMAERSDPSYRNTQVERVLLQRDSDAAAVGP